ncbi:MAG: phosphoenolpyruvate--protein phosphotransferase [Acidimicrobiia bacterium]
MHDPGRRLLRGVATSPGVGFGAAAEGVVVAPDLSPADVASLDPATVVGLATAGGAPLSHASIIARSLGIAAVGGLGPDVLDVPPGTAVLVDGDAGTLVIHPTAEEVAAARARQEDHRRHHDQARQRACMPATTADGTPVRVLANVGGAEEARLAVAEGADGVGMLRTEFAFLGRTEPPGEDEQYTAYRAVAQALGDRPLVVRTLDLGADVPAWDAPPEDNPALGHRGLRFTLTHRHLLETQLRAVTRLARDREVQVMFPMVTSVDELRQAQACLEAVAGETGGAALGSGITVEIPAAALTAAALAPLVDFFGVGTNDLTQYALATDRANPAVAALADGLHPAVLRLIAEVVGAGAAFGRPVFLVGELATDPAAIPVLLGLGVRALSVRPNAVAVVKEAVRAVALPEASVLADRALRAESPAAVRRLV